MIHDHFHGIKEAMNFYDMTPETDELEAMLLEVAEQCVGPTWEDYARDAVGKLVAGIARPLDGWPAAS